MTVDPDALAQVNLLYRDPALCDEMFADTDHGRLVRELVDEHRPQARTLIDFGCGTGRDIADLADRFESVGIEAQPGLVEHARAVRPHVDIRVGDLCSIRLGHTADVLLCLGNVLAYLHDDHALACAFATFAAHAHPGTLLIIGTMTTPPTGRRIESPMTVHDDPAHITIDTSYDPSTRIATTRRIWLVDGREHAVDHIQRRVISRDELHRHLDATGFTLRPPGAGPSTVVAIYSGSP